MSINKGFKIEVERETNNTRRLLEVLQDEHLSYKPHEKSMSLGELAKHIVGLHNWVKEALAGDVYDFQTMYIPFNATNVEDIIAVLNNGLEANIATIESTSDDDWQRMWTLQSGNHVIASLPKIGAFRFIVQNHLIHHRGQLTVYMRLLDLPLPGMYGPSADEKQ